MAIAFHLILGSMYCQLNLLIRKLKRKEPESSNRIVAEARSGTLLPKILYFPSSQMEASVPCGVGELSVLFRECF